MKLFIIIFSLTIANRDKIKAFCICWMNVLLTVIFDQVNQLKLKVYLPSVASIID